MTPPLLPLRVRAFAFVSLLVFSALPLAALESRPFSQAERAALVLLQGELRERGVSGASERVRDQLDALMDDRTLREGERRGRWEMQTSSDDNRAVFRYIHPSGIDDFAVFQYRGGSIVDVQTFYAIGKPAPLITEAQRAAQTAAPLVESAPFVTRDRALWAGFVLFLLLGVLMRNRRALAVPMFACAVACIVAVMAFKPRPEPVSAEVVTAAAAVDDEPEEKKEARRERELFERKRLLQGVRDAFDTGMTDPDRAIAALDKSSGFDARTRADIELLRAHADVLRTRLDRADALLADAKKPWPASHHLLAARLHTTRMKDIDALAEYDEVLRAMPENDAILIEAAEAAFAFGLSEKAEAYLRRAEKMGSRNARTYYLLARVENVASRIEQGEQYFLHAYALEPVSRAEVLTTPAYAPLLRRPAVAKMLQLWSSRFEFEPVYRARCQQLAGLDNAGATGEHLLSRGLRGRLSIPGGLCLATDPSQPPYPRTFDETRERRELDETLMLYLDQWIAAAATPGPAHTIGGPLEQILDAFHADRDWGAILDVTDRIPVREQGISADALMLRALALRHTGRTADANNLLIEIAKGPALKLTRDPETLGAFAELYANAGFLDAAIKLLERAARIQPSDSIDVRILQWQTELRHAKQYQTHATAHLRINYSREVTPAAAMAIGSMLETEYARLTTIFPHVPFAPIDVNLLPKEEFKGIFTFTDGILGLYMGKVLVPFSGEFVSPETKATLTHELLHALLAQATRDNAPRWFQEGLAQTAERKQGAINAFKFLPRERQIAEELLEAAFRCNDPVYVQSAYQQAETMIYQLRLERSRGALPIYRLAQELRVGIPVQKALHIARGMPGALGTAQWAAYQPEAFPGIN